jgi:F-type H+-transporting ATPase subunit gamma
MSNLKQLRLRIKSIKSTKKITKAMQMVSASKLRKNKLLFDKSKDYFDSIENTLATVMNSEIELHDSIRNLLTESSTKEKLLIVMGSDRGLCGSFNYSIFRNLRNDIENYKKNSIKFKIVVIGKKILNIIKNHYNEFVLEHHESTLFSSQKILELSSNLLKLSLENNLSIDIYFSEFKNTITQIPTRKVIFPLESAKRSVTEIVIEGENIINKLLEMYMISKIQYHFLENRTSEEASRTSAMDNATNNAADMINKLTLVMNRNRQSIITNELIEIISGAEAL